MEGFPKVGVMGDNRDIMEGIADVLRDHGYPTATMRLEQIKRGRVDLVGWLNSFNPEIIIYDVGFPYGEHMNFLRLLQSSGAWAKRCVILTSTNPKALEEFLPGIVVHQMLGLPADIDKLFQSIVICHDDHKL